MVGAVGMRLITRLWRCCRHSVATSALLSAQPLDFGHCLAKVRLHLAVLTAKRVDLFLPQASRGRTALDLFLEIVFPVVYHVTVFTPKTCAVVQRLPDRRDCALIVDRVRRCRTAGLAREAVD